MADLSNHVTFELEAAGKEIDNGTAGYAERAILYGCTRALCYAIAEVRESLADILGRMRGEF